MPKTIPTMDEIKAIGVEMNQQDHRSTAWPLYVVQEDVERWVNFFDDWTGKKRKEETDDEDLCNACLKKSEVGDSLIEDCDNCHPSAFHYYKLEVEFSDRPGTFLTLKECQAHIDANSHHYSNPRVYTISAWRNQEMQRVMTFLSALGSEDGQPHRNYQ